MISAGSRDGRKMAGLGFGVGGGSKMEMEDTELEEGEACSYKNDEEVNIDPDDLTYIDEKIQSVLGHFKKDFEGGVFTENLGAKYGGYGSFLTQRSPVGPCSRSPANVQNSQSHKSPTCLSAEGGSYSSLAPSNGCHSLKHESSNIHTASSEHYKAPSRHDLVRQIAQARKHSIEESTAKTEAVEKSTNIIEPRTLKVRIKVGSDNLSGKKNAAICQELGLVSPSSSFDDSPIGREGLSQGLQFPGDESPDQIIRIMTSFPVYGDLLLSPLPEALAQWTEKLLQDNTVEPASRHNWGSSVIGSIGMTAKILPEGKNHAPSKRKKDSERTLNDSNLISKNQADFDSEACEELVSEALKLPLLSDFHGSSGGKRGTSKQKSNVLSNALRHEPVMPILKCDGGWKKKQNVDENLAVNVAREEEVHLQNDVPSFQKKGDRKGQATNTSTNTNTNDFGAKSIKGSLTRPNVTQKRKNGKESMSIEQEGMKLPSGGEQLPLGEKKKMKGSHATGSLSAEISKGSIKNVVSGRKDSHMADNHSGKEEIRSFAKKKDSTKFKDKYKDFFGDMNEDGDDLMDSPDEPSTGRLKTYKVSEKGLNSCESNTRERASKGDHEQLMPKVHPNRTSDFAPPEHVPLIGEPAPAVAPVEDWVQCDKCLKWRLLPYDTKGDSLPEKWLCNMLSWLPGMNSCSITEEETTKAVARLYQPQNLNGVSGILSEGNPGTVANAMHPEQGHQDIFPVNGKKHDLKEVPNSKHSLKNSSLTVAARSHLENEPHAPRSRVPTDSFLETNQHKKKSKKKHHDKYSNRGHSKISKREGEIEPNHDHARASKKMKVEQEGYISTRDTGSEKLIHSNNELLISQSQKYQPVNRECSSRSSKGHNEDSLQHPMRKSKFQVQASPSADFLDAKNDNDINGAVKKRKGTSSQNAYSPSSLTGKISDENEETGQKKARVSVSEKKASSSSRGNSTAVKKTRGTKDKDVDEHRALKRDVGSAATSSSSKVSGSQRSKSILRDVKSSPVESVSSSPFRDSDRNPSGIKNGMENTFHNIGILAKDNSIRVADAKADSVSGRSGATRNNLCGNDNRQSVHGLKDGTEGFLVADKVQIKHSGDQADSLDHCNVNGVFLKQSAKEPSLSKSKDNTHKIKSESVKGNCKITGTHDDLQDHAHVFKDKTKDINIKFQDKPGWNADSIEMDFGGKKKSSEVMLGEQSKKNSKLKSVGLEASAVKADANLEMGSVAKKKANTGYGEKRSKTLEQDKDEKMDLQRGKEKATNKNDLSNSVLRPYQGNGVGASGVNVPDGGKGSKDQMSSKKSDVHSSSSKHQLSDVHKVKDREAPSPMRRDSHNHAASNALKEAKDLKHLADRLKNSGSAESTGIYFQAALKFLHGASLLESRSSENSKRGDVIKSMDVYSSTAKLCEFCAHEYEKSKDQACAALAYKCMEVAYLRVIYSSHPAASRDRHELQRSLQMGPPGESPSSSASDLDNASNLATAEKAAQARYGNSPQPAGNHVISASNRPNFERLMKYMKDVNSAMEASRRTQGAFAAAQADMQQACSNEGIALVKRVVNFNFHDVDGFLRLVRLAVEAIKQ